METDPGNRETEWFVPKAGPAKLRFFIGLLFLPYTAMVLSFSVIGSVLVKPVHWDRTLALIVIYFLGLGIGAHTLDALGSKGAKPWGAVFSKGQLWLIALSSLALAYAVAAYYMVRHVPLLWPIALCEGFFVFAYNLELFQGRFHNDRWFAFSWGFLPVLAGYVMQTNRVSIEALILASSAACFSLVEINASRPYKELKKRSQTLQDQERLMMARYETILKSISLGVILLSGGLLIWRVLG
ncbi:MAG: hypothetical protein L7F78_11555 [Syntrophales bacterium LBB04]|nr:hypothetical protein [Syntrophales bacterium LBB04]